MALKYLQKYPNYTLDELTALTDVTKDGRVVKAQIGDGVVTQFNEDGTNVVIQIFQTQAEIDNFKDMNTELEVGSL